MKPSPSLPMDPAHAEPHARPGAQDGRRRQVSSANLFGTGREILIEHAGELYSLRQTSKGKLILTK